MTDPALDELRAIVDAAHVLVDPDQRAGFETDWTGRYAGRSAAVVRPASTSQVAAVLAYCNEAGIVVVPQAGNSGLVGGSVPRSDDWRSVSGDERPAIVLSLTRLHHLGPVDASALQVTAGAGVTLADWRRHANAAALDTPVDFAARDVATVGGAIATNAGGSRVLRFGTMRAQIVGIEAVTAGGAVVGSLSGLPKETVGFHWPSVLAGSEGTLAVVTDARLRLVPRFEHTVTAMVALSSMDDAVELVGTLRRQVPALDALEFVQPAALALVADHLGRRPPVEAPAHGLCVIIECADHTDPTDLLHDALQDVSIVDAAVTSDAGQRTSMLEFRDRLTEAIAAESTKIGVPTFKLDVAVPLDQLGWTVATAQAAARRDGALLIPFGHLAEGNAHLNFLGAREFERIAETVLEAVASVGGTISAEHGIGIAKVHWLPLVRSPADLAAQRALKLALDPHAILNPGVLGR
jgi:FAD/FMN-containing dehydrogenase